MRNVIIFALIGGGSSDQFTASEKFDPPCPPPQYSETSPTPTPLPPHTPQYSKPSYAYGLFMQMTLAKFIRIRIFVT